MKDFFDKNSIMDIYHVAGSGIGTIEADITKMDMVEAVVNAANNSLLGGGGVDGAIHRAAGHAKITSGYEMPCRHIIHTVGPVWRGGDHNEADLLAACYRSSLKVAMENGIRTIAFPSISTGIFSYPVEEAAYIAVNTVIDFLRENPGKFVFVLWAFLDKRIKAVYDHALSEAAKHGGEDIGKAEVIITRNLDDDERSFLKDKLKDLGTVVDYDVKDTGDGHLLS